MPHIIIKLYPGRTEEVKQHLANQISKCVADIAKCSDKAVSIAIEEIPQNNWAERVYKPDILDKEENLYKKPGYNPFA